MCRVLTGPVRALPECEQQRLTAAAAEPVEHES